MTLHAEISPKQKHFLEFLVYQDSDSRKKLNGLICQWISRNFRFLAETKMEETEPLVTENKEFQYRDETL